MLIELAGRRPMLRRDTAATPAGGSHLVVDARNLLFASPLDVAAIIALTRRADNRGRSVTLVMPTDVNVGSYLQRMDVLRQLPTSAQVLGTIPAEVRSDCSDVLVEVSPLSATTAQSLVARLGRLASAHFAPASAAAVFRSIGELIDNATSHGGSRLGAFLAAQAYTGATTGRPGFEFAVCDTGIGIREHLRSNPKFRKIPDATSAIACALQPGVTGTGEQRGYGLSDLLRVTSDGGTGRLVLRSEDGIASVVLRRDQRRRAITTATPAISGTWAWLRSQFP